MATDKSKRVIIRKAEDVLMPISIEDVQDKIIVLRGEPVILDRNVAELYGVQTREINQAVKNNQEKFPSGYIFVLSDEEVSDLRSKILTTNSQGIQNNTNNNLKLKKFNLFKFLSLVIVERVNE